MSSTAKTASSISGDKLYQERARATLPRLVRQATAGKSIFYSDLAEELGMPNPRNLNYVLGSIGQAMLQLSKKWKEKIPPIQCLVVNKATGIPGEGIGWFLISKEDFSKLPLRRRREIVQAELQHIYSYPHWERVLAELELEPAEVNFTTEIVKAAGNLGGGESPEHKRLKDYVAKNPKIVGISVSSAIGVTEFRLPSGDSLDVSFDLAKQWLAVEVKSRLSAEPDIVRGIFQCVKYQAILDAMLLTQSRTCDARAILVLESNLPSKLKALSNLLGVEVVDGVSPH